MPYNEFPRNRVNNKLDTSNQRLFLQIPDVITRQFGLKDEKYIEPIIEEVRLMQEQELDYNLVKIFAGDIQGSDEEKELLRNLQQKLGDKIYIETIYILTHKLLKSAKLAKELYSKILEHRGNLSNRLERKTGVEVAALDYLGNVHSMLGKPAIIERDKLMALAMKATKDKTTGIYVRDLFKLDLKYEIKRAKRYKKSLSILFCDLDNFKKINDFFGHQVGDVFLKEVSQAIQSTLRDADKMYRYGGEEFVCLLPEADLKAAAVVANRVKKKIAELRFPVNEAENKTITTSLSIGVSEFGKGGIYNSETLIAAADRMMYKAKRAGKNRVCLYEPEQRRRDEGKPINYAVTGYGKARIVLKGKGISEGYGIGRAFVYKDILSRDLLAYRIEEEDILNELKRIKNAIDFALADLRKMKNFITSKIDKKHTAIFEAHEEILKDELLLDELEQELKRELVNAEQTVKNVFRKWSNKFKAMDSEVHKSKADDIDDLSRKILQILLGYRVSTLEKLPPNSIIVARRLLPSDTVSIDRNHSKGIVVEHGSKNSHSAILARTMGIPAVANLGKTLDVIKDGDELILDGTQEKVIIYPNKNDKEYYRRIIQASYVKDEQLLRLSHKRAVTKNGERVLVYANVSTADDVNKAFKCGCDGIGLFRIENLFLAHKLLPREKDLVSYMSQALNNFGKKTINLRLLDVGGDKKIPHVNIEDELNTYLGLRGIRLLLYNQHLLKTQLRAALLLGKEFKIRILLPMVTLPEEIRKVRDCMEVCRKELANETKSDLKSLKIGTMIETPAAMINLKKLAEHSDFLSIGTNDLIQYVMAASREDKYVSHYYDEGIKLILNQIKNIVDVANTLRKECCICGEIAADQRWTEELLKVGIRHFSVSPNEIPRIKNKLRSVEIRK